jgi:hypothetical protein
MTKTVGGGTTDDELLQARLLLAVLDDKNWQVEVPLLVRGLLRRQQNGHWQGTQSNLWGGFVVKRFNDNMAHVTGTSSCTTWHRTAKLYVAAKSTSTR